LKGFGRRWPLRRNPLRGKSSQKYEKTQKNVLNIFAPDPVFLPKRAFEERPESQVAAVVPVGTVFEASHFPIGTWMTAMFIICSSKKTITQRGAVESKRN